MDVNSQNNKKNHSVYFCHITKFSELILLFYYIQPS